ncbi:MAG: VPLPA-CTERM sorting domain-containing protein [Paracoccaceae bacterium]
MWKQTAIAAAITLSAAAGASAATTDTIEAPDGYFVPTDAQRYDSPYYRYYGAGWSWAHNAITEAFTTATLQISAFDVDYSSGELDLIEAFDAATSTWINLGYLIGANDAWAYTDFVIGADLLDDVADGLQVRMTIDSGYGGWAVTLAKSVITTDGATPPPPDPGAQVPLPAAFPLLLGGLAAVGGLRLKRRKTA